MHIGQCRALCSNYLLFVCVVLRFRRRRFLVFFAVNKEEIKRSGTLYKIGGTQEICLKVGIVLPKVGMITLV